MLRRRCPDAAGKIHRVYNGLDLSNLPTPPLGERPPGPTTILSVGRLVPFKGFEILLEACAELDRRNFDFRCQIVGDGPLRQKLEAMIGELRLRQRVELCGSLSQAEVFAKLQSCDIFALASVVDAEGASDVFPTVIMEAMACARPVVSTKLAGIPESVIDGLTGLLVPSENWEEFADALDKLVRDSGLRQRMGEAGRVRIKNEFSVEKTLEPLHALFAAQISAPSAKRKPAKTHSEEGQVAYLIDRWPDGHLPFLEMELRALRRENVSVVPFLFHAPQESQLSAKTLDLITEFQYLPDAMVVEAEWQASFTLLRELEAMRAEQKNRPPSDLFLEQARFASILAPALSAIPDRSRPRHEFALLVVRHHAPEIAWPNDKCGSRKKAYLWQRSHRRGVRSMRRGPERRS